MPGKKSHGVQSVAIAVIGDEVLAGEVADANLFFLAGEIARAGADLVYSAVLPDRMEFLVEHLRWMTGRFDLVVATGGIGPTHDDITRQASAEVFSLSLVEHPDAVSAMEKGYGGRLRPKSREMALLPAGAALIPNPVSHAPGFVVENLIVLPGIPELVCAMFPFVASRFSGPPLFREEIRTPRGESEIADQLAAAALEFPQVKIGSYPVLRPKERDQGTGERGEKGFRVRLVLRSRDRPALAAAATRLREFLQA